MEAKVLRIGVGCGNGQGKTGRSLHYVAKVQFNDSRLVCEAYTSLLNLKLGDEYEIMLRSK